nr:MAG TPA: hypothetical protein [Caudoviricetes sp.]
MLFAFSVVIWRLFETPNAARSSRSDRIGVNAEGVNHQSQNGG